MHWAGMMFVGTLGSGRATRSWGSLDDGKSGDLGVGVGE